VDKASVSGYNGKAQVIFNPSDRILIGAKSATAENDCQQLAVLTLLALVTMCFSTNTDPLDRLGRLLSLDEASFLLVSQYKRLE